MFDARIRPLIDPSLNKMGVVLARSGVSADAVTIAGFVIGMMAFPAVVASYFTLAVLLIAISRLADGLDGAVARATVKTDRGGFLDIVLDFIFYGAMPLAFAIYDPQANALACAVLLLSFFANGTTFLAFAIMAQKRSLETSAQGVKSLYYMAGLAEGSETIAFLLAICLFPSWFAVMAYVYATLCFASAAGRVVLAWRTLDGVIDPDTSDDGRDTAVVSPEPQRPAPAPNPQ
ncbi:MAG: CDP-alcohol phosphatidyltransferase family protein [Pseudomonadota bacterium]